MEGKTASKQKDTVEKDLKLMKLAEEKKNET